MLKLITVRQEGNRTVGVAMDPDGKYYIATTLAKSSKPYKTLLGAIKWLARQGYADELWSMGYGT